MALRTGGPVNSDTEKNRPSCSALGERRRPAVCMWYRVTLSRSRRAASASRSGVGVAAAPCTNTRMPLLTNDRASSALTARLIHSVIMRSLYTSSSKYSAAQGGRVMLTVSGMPGGMRRIDAWEVPLFDSTFQPSTIVALTRDVMSARVLLGDEAVALGAVHAGVTAAYAYPGTPSTEILEYLQRLTRARQEGRPWPPGASTRRPRSSRRSASRSPAAARWWP
jgi:hypothetical protein